MDIIKGRKAVEEYRQIHNDQNIHPIEQLMAKLKAGGFETIAEFFEASDKLEDGWK